MLKRLFVEHCPKCKKALKTTSSKTLRSIVIKSCSEGHYQKEYHPALETYIESNRIS